MQIQKYDGTIEDYATLSKKQIVAADFTLISDAVTPEKVLTIEYSGSPAERELHFYGRAVRREDGRVFLITATAPVEQWSRVSAKLKKCVDSFKLLR